MRSGGDPHPAPGNIKAENILGAGSEIQVINPAGDMIRLENQGSGLQRAFLWSALKAIVETGKLKQKNKAIPQNSPRILLIDEPEAFLHPQMIRLARESLYSLADLANWQIIITTHSPIFIDVSKPHTTIVRVDESNCGARRVFRCEQANFSDDEWESLRMIRSCNPMVNEFFFADEAVLVEGETEHLVLCNLLQICDEQIQSKIHIVNCMGKSNIPLFARILNQFGTSYTILHDSDKPRSERKSNKKWQKNAMWSVNNSIRAAVDARPDTLPPSQTIVHIPDFEGHYFKQSLKSNKPRHAMDILASKEFKEENKYPDLSELIVRIIDRNHPNAYDTIEQLNVLVKNWVEDNPDQATPLEAWELEYADAD